MTGAASVPRDPTAGLGDRQVAELAAVAAGKVVWVGIDVASPEHVDDHAMHYVWQGRHDHPTHPFRAVTPVLRSLHRRGLVEPAGDGYAGLARLTTAGTNAYAGMTAVWSEEAGR